MVVREDINDVRGCTIYDMTYHDNMKTRREGKGRREERTG